MSNRPSGPQDQTAPFHEEKADILPSNGEQFYASCSNNTTNNNNNTPVAGTNTNATSSVRISNTKPLPSNHLQQTTSSRDALEHKFPLEPAPGTNLQGQSNGGATQSKQKHAQVLEDQTVEIILPAVEDNAEDREQSGTSDDGDGDGAEAARAEVGSTGTTWDPDFFTPKAYLRRCLGAGHPGPAWLTFSWDAIPACIFSMINMTLLATLEYYGLEPYNLGMLSYLPSFGASSTLVFYLYTSPGAQPRALILTHICGAFLGISWSHIMDGIDPPLYQLLACAFAVAMMTALMMLTNSFQPSASATTCLAALHLYGQMKDQGYMFMVTPATIGPVIIVFLGWLFNNLIPWRHCYPCWF